MTLLIVAFINMLVNFASNHLPSYDFESGVYNGISDAIVSVVDFLAQINFIVPLGDLAYMLLMVIAVRLASMALFVANWIIRRIADVIP